MEDDVEEYVPVHQRRLQKVKALRDSKRATASSSSSSGSSNSKGDGVEGGAEAGKEDAEAKKDKLAALRERAKASLLDLAIAEGRNKETQEVDPQQRLKQVRGRAGKEALFFFFFFSRVLFLCRKRGRWWKR